MSKKIIEPTIYTLDIPLYYSGFCLTDNTNFSEFYLNRIPKLNYQFKEFKFTEENLIYGLEKNEVNPIVNRKNVLFGDFVLDKFIYYNYFIRKYKEVKFYFVKSFLSALVVGVVGIMKEDKLIGVLLLKRRKK